jgi:hypothetical protein
VVEKKNDPESKQIKTLTDSRKKHFSVEIDVALEGINVTEESITSP